MDGLEGAFLHHEDLTAFDQTSIVMTTRSLSPDGSNYDVRTKCLHTQIKGKRRRTTVQITTVTPGIPHRQNYPSQEDSSSDITNAANNLKEEKHISTLNKTNSTSLGVSSIERKKVNSSKAFGLCLLAYTIALGVAVAVGFVLISRLHPILATFAADVAATLVIYVFSCIFRNASFYDSYWSVAPIVIAVYWMLTPESVNVVALRQTVAFALVLFWGLRLTYNWARRWRGNEDWRYADIRKQNPGLFWLANLIGIELMPTLLVFLGCLSLYPTLSAGSNPFGFLDGIAIVITVSAILMETIADEELGEFVRNGEETRQTLSSGLWAYTRHPNYLGEMGFWWGLYFFSIAADLDYWWTFIGPVGITLLFIFVSIPMIEKHLSRRSGYAEYQQRVSKLVPWFPKE